MLPIAPSATPSATELDLPDDLNAARELVERRIMVRVLTEEKAVLARVLERLGISSSNFYRRLERYGIDPEQYR